jgi:hypothetical protein
MANREEMNVNKNKETTREAICVPADTNTCYFVALATHGEADEVS